MTTPTFSLADRLAHDAAQGPVRRCSVRTPRGMRTPTGDFLTCTGQHALGEPHGAAFGESGWFTWTDQPARKVLERFPAGAPRGSWPAEEFAQGLRRDGRTVDVVMDLKTDTFLVVEGES